MDLLIRGGRVIDPAQGIDRVMDVWVRAGKIAALEAAIPHQTPETRVIEAQGRIVAPGFLDIHTHLREPGFEYKETIATGLTAAAASGFTGVAAMANTQPVHDTPAVTELMLRRAAQVGGTRLYPIGAVSAGLQGKDLAEIGAMHQAGIVGVSDDGMPVMNGRLMRRAMEYASMLDIPVLSHCEDRGLAGAGAMHEGLVATTLGLPGIPAAAEAVMAYRDIQLAALTGARLHLQHVSTAETVALVRRAKESGLAVTAEACPHHFTLTDAAVRGYDTNTKINPPLRPQGDVDAVKAGLRDGTIDVIASDHAPHHVAEKEQDYMAAPAGIIGLETSVGLSLALYHQGCLSLPQVIAAYTHHPAHVLGLPQGALYIGQAADITILDVDYEYEITVDNIKSRSKNTPFLGWKLRGAAVMTVVNGMIIWERV